MQKPQGLRDTCYSFVTNSFLEVTDEIQKESKLQSCPKNLHIWQQLHLQPMAVWMISNSRVI